MANQFQRALKRLRLFRVDEMAKTSNDPRQNEPEEETKLMQANLLSSRHQLNGVKYGHVDGGSWATSVPLHDVVLDIDRPCQVIESTNGNSHLLIEMEPGIPEEIYFNLLDALAAAGVVEEGYAAAAKRRGYTAVRLPWVVKGEGLADPKPFEGIEDDVDKEIAL